MIAFDFDKTLCPRDTVFGFYRIVHGNGFLFQLKRLLILGAAGLNKLKLINNTQLKRIGVFLFLKGRTEEHIRTKGKEYAETIELNLLYHKTFCSIPQKERLIISASFEAYLKWIFPKERCYGSRLLYMDGKVEYLAENCHGYQKVKRLQNEGIQSLEVVYSDSSDDKPLLKIAKRMYLVKDGAIHKEINQ